MQLAPHAPCSPAALRTLRGDLLDAGLPAVGHGCNCAGSMGGGVARQVRERWPDLHAEYLERCRSGSFRLGDAWAWTAPDGTIVYNLATQQQPGRDARLDAVRTSVAAMLDDAARRDLAEVAVPRLGAGIGGLDWPDVAVVLTELEAASTVGLVVVQRPKLS